MMEKMRDLHNFSAKAFKGVLFTGAQGSKKLEKVLFHHIYDHLPILRHWYVEKFCLREMDEIWAKALCLHAPKQAKTGKSSFSTHLWASSKSETLIYWESLIQRFVQNLSKEGQRLLVHRRPSRQKPEKPPFQHICKHLPNPRHWYIQKDGFRDVYKTWAKRVKGSLFTGAQASKSRKKRVFNTSVRIFLIRDIDMFRTMDSEIWPKVEQREPKAPCSQAPKLAKAGKSVFSTHLWASF